MKAGRAPQRHTVKHKGAVKVIIDVGQHRPAILDVGHHKTPATAGEAGQLVPAVVPPTD